MNNYSIKIRFYKYFFFSHFNGNSRIPFCNADPSNNPNKIYY